MSFVALKTFQTDYNNPFLMTREGVILKRIIKIDHWCESMKLQKFGLIHLFIKIHLFIHSLIYTLNRSFRVFAYLSPCNFEVRWHTTLEYFYVEMLYSVCPLWDPVAEICASCSLESAQFSRYFLRLLFWLHQSIALGRRLQLKTILKCYVIADFSWFSEDKE